MRLYIIAGEASGDLHAANFVKELKLIDSTIELRGWGGDLMEQAGVKVVKHYRDLAFMGFIEVVKNLRTIFKNLKACVEDIEAFKPDAVFMVDYPGFNLRIAEKIKPLNVKIFYYISPQVWAWKQNRVHKIKKLVNKMFVILPFEKPFYKKFDFDVEFVGHPLLDAIEQFRQTNSGDFRKKNDIDDRKIIALLPGSRKQEILVKLPLMLSVIDKFSDYHFVVAAAPSLPLEFYDQFKIPQKVSIVSGQTYALLNNSYAALVTSGTATLETALFNVPEVVCYKGSTVSYQIAKRLIKVKYISLVNLIADKEVVKELIQADLNPINIEAELKKITQNEANRTRLLRDYANLREHLGGSGASKNVAIGVFKSLQHLP
ncbi:MAG TPA: lipid-A-disaccharide synthase [Flavobacteriales bacterium]|nr:lipid-A-disaccharide synthase [Flavobacteriales bacterium]